jgi:hypothetical protein
VPVDIVELVNRHMFLKTEDKYKNLLKKFKTEFNWNNGNLHILLASLTPNKIQELITKDLERQALEYTFD